MHLDEIALRRVDNENAHIDTRLNTIHPRKNGTDVLGQMLGNARHDL